MDTFLRELNNEVDKAQINFRHFEQAKGIVICAGGDLYNRLAYNLVFCLRQLKCKLPIQIWHLPTEECSVWSDIFRTLDADSINAQVVAENKKVACPMGGWQLKPFAVTHSTFRDVLLLDADNMPTKNPTYLFETPAFHSTGAFFWPSSISPTNHGFRLPREAWEMVGLAQDKGARQFDSGQLLVDRSRCAKALSITMFLNEWSDYVYKKVYGDKDTWLLGWKLAKRKFAMPAKNAKYMDPAIFQYDHLGHLIFQHAIDAKQQIVDGECCRNIRQSGFIPMAKIALEEMLKQHATL
tara:strand:- start:2781 stop:3668 length:888 start_codon:yes stop_codon:yes gene_type:complete